MKREELIKAIEPHNKGGNIVIINVSHEDSCPTMVEGHNEDCCCDADYDFRVITESKEIAPALSEMLKEDTKQLTILDDIKEI